MSLVEECQVTRKIFRADAGDTLPYCQGVYHSEQPGDFALLIFFHGAGERGTDNARQLAHCARPLTEYVVAHNMKLIALYPQCPDNMQWVDTPWDGKSHQLSAEPSRSMRLAMALLDAKIAEFKVDPARIYVSGISMGGYGTWDLVSRRPRFFAAAMPVCGGADETIAPALRDLPVRFYHGEVDGAVPVCRSRNMAAALQAAGSTSFRYTEIPNCGHDVWTACFSDTANFDWLFAQRRRS